MAKFGSNVLRAADCEINEQVLLVLLLTAEIIDGGVCCCTSPSIPVTFYLVKLPVVGLSIQDILEVELFVPFLIRLYAEV